MAQIETSKLAGAALDWVVAKIEGEVLSQANFAFQLREHGALQRPHLGSWKPSTSWAQGGPIIERERISLRPDCWKNGGCKAFIDRGGSARNVVGAMHGPTPLIAGLRCLVQSKMGTHVNVPDEIVKEGRSDTRKDTQSPSVTTEEESPTLHGQALVFSVPVTVDVTMSGKAIVSANNIEEAIFAARQLAADNKVAMTLDEGNYRGLADYYCPDENDVQVMPTPAMNLIAQTLENIGYDITEDSDQPGMWAWISPNDACDVSLPTKPEAIFQAWRHACECAQRALRIPDHQWREMTPQETAEKLQEAMGNNDADAQRSDRPRGL